jgi:hypothetical protein
MSEDLHKSMLLRAREMLNILHQLRALPGAERSNFVREMTNVVGDQLVADLVKDFRKGVPRGSSMVPTVYAPEEPSPPRSDNGWIEPRPMSPHPGQWSKAKRERSDDHNEG